MKDKYEMINALQNPQKAPFRVAFEIFASTDREKIAKWPKKLAELLKIPDIDFHRQDGSEAITAEAAKAAKTEAIEYYQSSGLDAPASRLLDGLEKHRARYYKVKEYFDQKIRELNLSNPLLFFDDQALRIDIGYGPKEMSVLFPDFFNHGGVFDKTILGGVSYFGKSPLNYFFDDYIEDDYQIFLNAEKERLLSTVAIELAPQALATKRKVSIENKKGFNEAEFITKCFDSNEGLIVGEVHEHKSPKQFLVDNMALFKSQGVTTIYMEHLLQERHQALLDVYLHSQPDAAMPRELELYLNYLDEERKLSGSATFTAVVQEAKKHQIRIVAVDSEASYRLAVTQSLGDLGDIKGTKERFGAMNMLMLERYREFNDGGKYIALIGSGHVATCLDVPGVSNLLNCPNILVNDLSDDLEEYIEQDILHGEAPATATFDVLYHRHQNSKQLTASVITQRSTEEKRIPADDAAMTQNPEKELQKNIINFEANKREIQKKFLENLTALQLELNKSSRNNTATKLEGERLYTALFTNQEQFFNSLSLQLTEQELNKTIIEFRNSCKEQIKAADKIMGHGWLYRIAEVVIKSVIGLFVGIGMVLGFAVNQGLAKSEHRQKFAQTFFALNQTDESKALNKFKQETLGDEKEEPGLLSESKFNK
ncbi:membrane-targeted effector domain-containing toxin [Legionella sp. 16cNR16C]|uniref:membrane-targeted effector domain-containing toxin n=1 Tax=Legionella sp. 16cNR16C TaxID=2905656 RepID=UPI001E5FF358|nr:membrane-targeted effector domain-containing toxin [Legionella sp. 16cNR16C]MCE3043534.1 membrane-targeted effector domain-containing toxin [Legionella sp. 16cNR16C]